VIPDLDSGEAVVSGTVRLVDPDRIAIVRQDARVGKCLRPFLFDIDVQQCPNCGGRLKILAAIVDPAVITKILTHLHLPASLNVD
jgi:hypothetical protein